jgi:hypothetical protein
MRNDQHLSHFVGLLAGFFVLLVLLPFSVYSQTASQSGSNRVTIHGSVDISTSYNDNILEYSSGDRAKFSLVKYAPANWKKFSIDRLDDYITSVKLRAGTTFNLIDHAPTSICLRTSQYLYHTTQMRNYDSWQAQMKQNFLKKNYVTLTYNTLPRYYLRNYWYIQVPERNPYRLFDRYVEAFISKQAYSFDVERKFSKKFSAEIGYEHEYIEYNREFSERNNHRYNLMVSSRLKITKVIELKENYCYTQSWADGRYNPDSTIVDISYKAHRIGLGFDVSLKSLFKIPLKWTNNFIFESQSFLSNKIPIDTVDADEEPISYGDKYHYGRKDKFYKITTELTYRLLKNFDVFARYSWEENKTNLPETTDAGNYQDHQVGGGIKVSF